MAKAIRDLRCTGILYQVLGLHPSVLNEKVVQNALMLKIPAAIHEIEYSWTAGYEGQANAILSVCCIPLWAQNEKIQQAVVDILLAFPYLEDYLENCSAIMEGLLHDKDRHEE